MPPFSKLLNAFKWSFFAEVVGRTVGPLVFLVMARLLSPEAYGIVGTAMVVISFSQVFWEAGLAKALIQRQTGVEASANSVFWMNLTLGLLIFLLLQLFAPLVAIFFHEPKTTLVIRFLAFQIPIAAFSSVHTALFQKSFSFKTIFWIRLSTSAIPGLASIPLAYYGHGYMALVVGSLVGQLAQTILIWTQSPWRPSWSFQRETAKALLTFGIWPMLSGLLGWFYCWADSIVVGHYLGAKEMGLYRTGNTFVTMAFGLFFSPLMPVIYSFFSKSDTTPQQKHRFFGKLYLATCAISLAMAILIVLTSDFLAEWLFSSKFTGVNSVIVFLAIQQGISWINCVNYEYFRGIGKPHVETIVNAVLAPISLGIYLYFVRFGLNQFLHGRVLATVVCFFAHLATLKLVASMIERSNMIPTSKIREW